MIKGLLFVGLVLIPLILRLDFFPILPRDIEAFRMSKEFLSILFAGSIGLSAIYLGQVKPIKNYWMLVLLLCMMISRFIGPAYDLPMFNTNLGAFWVYQPLSYALIYFLMYVGVSSQDWDIKLISKIIGWVGFIAAFYLGLQYFGLDQFQIVFTDHHNLAMDSPGLSSTLSQFNFSGSFIALCIPFVIYNKWWIKLAVMIAAVIATKSQVSVGMLCIVLSSYLFYKSSRDLKIMLSGLGVGVAALFFRYADLILPQIQSSGRFEIWVKIIKKTLENYPITGYTLGAYRYLFVNLEWSTFIQAHSEPLEFFFGMGIPITCILLIGIGWFFVRGLPFLKDEETFVLYLCFFSIFTGSWALFVWQIDPHRFYSVAILGLLTSKIRKGEQSCLTKK